MAPKGIAPLFVITALLVISLSFERYRAILNLRQPAFAAISAFVVLAAISSIWSLTPGETLYSAMILALTCLGGLAITIAASNLTIEERAFVEKSSIVGGAIGLALILFEYSTDGFIKQSLVETFMTEFQPDKIYYLEDKPFSPALSPGVTIYAFYIWPLAAVVERRFGLLALILALLGLCIAIAIGRSYTPILAIGLGLIMAIGALLSSRITAILSTAGIVIAIAAMPFFPGILPNPNTETLRLSYLPPSALHRLTIWNTASERFKERPWLGIGMNATRSLYSRKDAVRREYFADDPDKKWYNIFEPIPLHAHNGILQIWLELGLIGAIALGAILLSLIKMIRIGFRQRIWTASCFGLYTSAIIVFSLSFGPWQSWWQSALWLSAGFMVAARNGDDIDAVE